MLTRMYEIIKNSYSKFTTDEFEIVDPDDSTNYGYFIDDTDLDRIRAKFNIDKKEFNDFLETLK